MSLRVRNIQLRLEVLTFIRTDIHLEQGKESTCAAGYLCLNDLINFRDNLYRNSTKVEQNNFLLRHMKVDLPKRRRVKEDFKKLERSVSISYFVTGENGKDFPMCTATFRKVTGMLLRLMIKLYNYM